MELRVTVLILAPTLRGLDLTVNSLAAAGIDGRVEYLVVAPASLAEQARAMCPDRIRVIACDCGSEGGLVNCGHAAIRSELVAHLRVGDCHRLGAIDLMLRTFGREVALALAYGDWAETGKGRSRRCLSIEHMHGVLLHDCNYIHPSTLFYRRNLISRLGPFDSSLLHLAQHEFVLRVSKRRLNMLLMRTVLADCGDTWALGMQRGHEVLAAESRRLLHEYARPKALRPSALRMLRGIAHLQRAWALARRGNFCGSIRAPGPRLVLPGQA
jgi:hypothetical protein